MRYELLDLLRCPISKGKLTLKLISEFEKVYSDGKITEVKDGILFSEIGLVFPIIDGIPRMLIESIYDYKEFLIENLPGYAQYLNKIEQNYPSLVSYCYQKNKKTKQSFELEWSYLNIEKQDRIWDVNLATLPDIFLSEIGETAAFVKDKKIIDVGCGHGVMTSTISEISDFAIGVELSKAVINAYNQNKNKNAWYIQGDLQFLPFDYNTFDLLYSSGVIHHTNNTELSLSLIEPVLKSQGKICIWLYHPQKHILHNLSLVVRSILKKMPLSLSLIFLTIFVLPFTFLIKKMISKKAPNYREEIINLLDAFTPEFRFEISQDLAMAWLQRRKYRNICITTSNQFGFSISGEKSN